MFEFCMCDVNVKVKCVIEFDFYFEIVKFEVVVLVDNIKK